MNKSNLHNLIRVEHRKYSYLYLYNFAYYLFTMIVPSILFILIGLNNKYFTTKFYHFISTSILAIFNYIILFSHLHKNNELECLYSMPIKRDDIFNSKFILGILFYIIPSLISYCSLFFILLYFSPYTLINQNQILNLFLLNFCYYLYAGLITIFSMIMTSKIKASITISIIFILLDYLFYAAYTGLDLCFFEVNQSGVINSHAGNGLFYLFKNLFIVLSPISLYIESTVFANFVICFILLIVFCISIYKLNLYTYKLRKPENNQYIFSFNLFTRLFRIILSILIGIFGAELIILMYEFEQNAQSKLSTGMVMSFLFTTITFALLNLIDKNRYENKFYKFVDYVLAIIIPIAIIVMYSYYVGV